MSSRSIVHRHRGAALITASSAVLVALAVASQAQAQTKASATTTTSDLPAETTDIIVTARRRDESQSKVPIAITAIGADDMVKRAITTDADLQRTIPGLTIRQTQGNNSLTYSLRGQSADIFSGSPSAVVTYLNEVPIPVSGASTFFDLQSVQALKGPQGTLFGRNATGGAVLFTSAQPTNDAGATARVRYGNFDRQEFEGTVNVPIVDNTVLLRGAINHTHDDGFIRNLYTGDRLGRINRTGGRLTLTIKPGEGISNTTMLQYAKSTGTNTGASYTYSVYAPGETNNGRALNTSVGFLFGPTLDLALGSGAWAAYLAAHPKAYAPGLVAYVAQQRALGPYVTNHPGGARHFGESWTLTNKTEIELGPDIRLRNIFGLVDSYTDSDQPQLGAPFVTILTENASKGQFGNVDDLRSYSEELQLQAKWGALDLIVGAYFQRQRVNTEYPQTYFDLSPNPGFPVYATNRFRIRNFTDAVYAQGTYDLGSIGAQGLKLTAGIRFTRERVYGFQLPRSDNFGPPQQKRTYSDPSWEVGLQYQADPGIMIYLKTRGSFRSGGYNGTLNPVSIAALGASPFFNSETTQDVEGGAKYNGRLFGRRATLSLALFNQWIQHVQRVEFPDPDGPGPVASIAFTTNVPAEIVRGVELEGTIMPADWLRIGGQLALTHAKFTRNSVVLFGNVFSYGPVGDTPRSSGSLWGEISAPRGGAGDQISLRGEVYAQTGQYFSNAAATVAPRTRLPGYALVSSRLSWANVGGSAISAALFAENLLDKQYFVGGMQQAVALGQNGAVVGKPRTYGVEVSVKF